jgi:hypothetical protein
MRQIRKFETRRDDPLVDGALRRLAEPARTVVRFPDGRCGSHAFPDEAGLKDEALPVLKLLSETGAVLAVAADMEKAIVVRESPDGTTRSSVVEQSLAQAMALKEWIAPQQGGRVTRYRITAVGKAMLEDHATGQIAVRSRNRKKADQTHDWQEHVELPLDTARKQRMRYALTESPLVGLARRRDTNGKPFLTDAMVQAGERLREDFEIAQAVGDDRIGGGESLHVMEAGSRVAEALSHLGPGLSDVVLRCCCYLEGLEVTEQRLGWSARSGKVVLRIALLRLQKHYAETIGTNGPMIG